MSSMSVLLLLLLLSQSSQSTLLGWVESPGYPGGYLPHSSLNWSRCAPRGHALSLRLLHLDLEDSQDCENDALKVFSNGGLISVLCGRRDFQALRSEVNPSLVSTSGGCLSISFHSDFSNPQRHTGFRGFYDVHDFDECEDQNNQCSQFCHNFIGGYRCSCRHGYLLADDNHTCTVSCSEDLSGRTSGDVSSPSWPGSYAENADCVSVLSVESRLQLELHFSGVFDVEQSPDGQCIDGLRVETPSVTLGPFCGSSPPPSPLLTHSHHVRIRFTSDGFGTNRGFSLHFRTRDKVCPAEVTSHSTAAPQRAEHHHGQTVTVTCEDGYVVNSQQGVQTMTSQFEASCDITGTWIPSYTCEPVDCGFPEVPAGGVLQLVGSEPPHTQYQDQIQFKCSSEYYRLDGNDTYSCSSSGEWMSADGTRKLPECTAVCGRTDASFTSAGRILGGQNARLGQIPWQLLIKAPNRGGASLISDRWAVTAAHVVDEVQETSLSLFGGLIDGRTSSGPGVAQLTSDRIIIHPGYSKGAAAERTNYDNDIALIRFSSRVNFGPNLLPICLPEPDRGIWDNEQGTVSGWGGTENQRITALLKYAHISAYPVNECRRTPTTASNKAMTFTDNMFCAGAPGKDSCQGDSGGPFVLPMLSSDNGPYVLAGIVSWGAPCRGGDNKGYYTKVENYVEWIRTTMKKEDRT